MVTGYVRSERERIKEYIVRIKPVVAFDILLFALFFCTISSHGAMGEPCEGLNSFLIVDTKNHKMWLCQENKPVGEYEVELGLSGIEKRKKGDKKTPVGEYILGTPRPSVRFGIFIPVGYPTEEQVSNGYSGSAIGIHGPTRAFKRLASTTTRSDWTHGCIAVRTDMAISEIADWVKEQKVSKIIIR
jgi:hypothetical protein